MTLKKLEDNGTFTTINAANVPASDSIIFEIGSDGVYEVVLGVNRYTAVVFCTVRNSILAIMAKILHEAKCSEPNKDLLYCTTSLILTFQLFLAQLNQQYLDNWIYTVLDPKDLEALKCINTMITRMNEYVTCINNIEDCGCGCND